MNIVYDIVLMRPACVLLQVAMGGDPQATKDFDSKHWLVYPTENMKLYRVTKDQLNILIKRTEKEALI